MLGKKIQAILNCAILASGLVLLILKYPSNYPLASTLLSADALYLPALLDDLFKQGGKLADWYLTPAPYLFPDLLMYSIAWIFFKSPADQIIAHAVLQVVGTAFFIYLIASKCTSKNAGAAAVLAAILFTLLGLDFGNVETLAKTGNAYALIFTSAFHYGAFLLQLIVLSIVFLYADQRRNEKSLWLAALCVIAFVSALSDSIFLVQFSLPFAGALLVLRLQFRNSRLYSFPLLAAPLFFSLLGMKSYDFVISNRTKYPIEIEISKLGQQFDFLRNFFFDMFLQQPLIAVFLIAFYGVAFASIFYWPKSKHDDEKSTRLRFLLIFSLVSALTTIVATSVVTNLSSGPRYLIPFFYWPPIITIIVIATVLRSNKLHFISLAMLLTLAFHAPENNEDDSNPAVAQVKDIRCIVEEIKASGLHKGIATYWDAKPIQVFTGGMLKLLNTRAN
ncbi:hypothetical protein MJ904_10265 [Massilia sp. MB5]|uniref:hypothetical protein n=1 Tax=Massilia sp. MB5 TaxID=2919578 RepID=UPI001F0F2951|nr:hypothetical protein [Massilia sp. MB5]UMR32524.1 hypothetical protein MJ904_10265 [Massilia sp. MB5]